MNIIRIIKLKKINNKLNNLTEEENDFLNFFNNLKCVKHPKNINYFINENFELIFYYCSGDNSFLCNYEKVWLHFRNKYKMSDLIITSFIKIWFKKYLNIKINKISFLNVDIRNRIENYIKRVYPIY